ncbi:hypothetical protein [Mucilaginibacter gotjawali]|uniref:Uncharacterized protein n=2 Tax=Mucilaginibacter gotjawali TaxID=1550579 RepID=A0A120MY71_9SPHI|nr:hypothetical protein [Mucilaginibacter gotjawali]MBB3055717.1 hypothetical protein [Mucilaginibacter gotjawali]BAU54536.1 hypothetical protein MgSA37_02712 [Mucilaginibacter gotjawali]
MNKYKLILRRISLLLAVFGITFIILSCRNGAPQKHIEIRKGTDTNGVIVDTDKFSIALPAGWKHFVKESQGFKILFLMSPPVDNFSPNLNILTEDAHGASMEEYMTASDENMKSGGMVKDGSGDFEVNGFSGKYSTNVFNYQGRNIALKTYVFIKNGLAYVITGSCLTTQKDSYRPIFDKAVKTFKIK